MSTRNASAIWSGTLKQGKGTMKFSDYEGPFTFASRFQEGKGTNPEELIGAALSGCFSMFLSALISEENLVPESVKTDANVHLGSDDTGPVITSIELECEVECEGLSEDKFNELTAASKEKCPVSRLVSPTPVKLKAKLI